MRSFIMLVFLFFSIISAVYSYSTLDPPIPCELRTDSVNVTSTNLVFHFEPLKYIDRVEIQCSRLLDGRELSSFNPQNYPTQDSGSEIPTNAEGTKRMVIPNLRPGTLYYCRCISMTADESYQYSTYAVGLTTRITTLASPIMTKPLFFTFEEENQRFTLTWEALGQDITNITVQTTHTIPPDWGEHIVVVNNPSIAESINVLTGTFLDAHSYMTRLSITNPMETYISTVFTFVTPTKQLASIAIRPTAEVEQSDLVPQFNSHIYDYAMYVAQDCEEIMFSIDPLQVVTSIAGQTIDNESVTLDVDTIYNAAVDEGALELTTQSFALGEPGTITKFHINVGSVQQYRIQIIRSAHVFGVPKYQDMEIPEPVPCPKQERIFLRYSSFFEAYKEYFAGFIAFIAMAFVRSWEKSTRIKFTDAFEGELEVERSENDVISEENYDD